ncbi:MAG: phage holin family protein [Streptosporangiales bacterium]|nr:phage holin family protein [Streptosporangiales bacterium]
MSQTRTEPEAERAIEDFSFGELVALVTRDVSKLVRTEIELAKAELRNDVKRAGLGAGMFGAAGFFGYVALLFCSAALALGLAALGLPMWAGFLIVGGAYLLLAGLLGLIGLLNFKRMTKGQRTAQTIRANLALVRRGD